MNNINTQSLIRVKNELKRHNLEDRIIILDHEVRTARETAKALRVEINQIAKTVLCLVDEEPLLVITSGNQYVDLNQIAILLNAKKVKVAARDVVFQISGFDFDGVSPCGSQTKIKVLVDKRLDNGQDLFAAAGTNRSVFKISFIELLDLLKGNVSVF